MLELEELKTKLNEYKAPLTEVRKSLDIEGKKNRIEELEKKMEAPDFWNDPVSSGKLTQELKGLKDDVSAIDSLDSQFSDILDYIELGNEENDPEIAQEALEQFETFTSDFETLRIKTLLSGEYDLENAIVTLHSGAGGTEA